MFKGIRITIDEIINIICCLYNTKGETEIYKDKGWCIYTAESDVKLKTNCYIDDYPEYDNEDNAIYSDFIIENKLEFLFRDEMIQDVIISCLHQKNDVTNEEILDALLYYEKYDTFLTL